MVLGFAGCYNRVATFAHNWRDEGQREQQTTGRDTFVSLTFRLGEAFRLIRAKILLFWPDFAFGSFWHLTLAILYHGTRNASVDIAQTR